MGRGCACQPALSGTERKRKGGWMSGGELKAQKGDKTKKKRKFPILVAPLELATSKKINHDHGF